jgi:hypothetical protein
MVLISVRFRKQGLSLSLSLSSSVRHSHRHAMSRKTVTSESHALKWLNIHYFKCMEVDLFFITQSQRITLLHATFQLINKQHKIAF